MQSYRNSLVHSYAEGAALLGERRGWTVPGIRGTTVRMVSGGLPDGDGTPDGVPAVVISYHGTPVVTHDAKGWCFIDTGHYYTATTTSRIAACLPHGWWVYRAGGVFVLVAPDGSKERFVGKTIITPLRVKLGTVNPRELANAFRPTPVAPAPAPARLEGAQDESAVRA